MRSWQMVFPATVHRHQTAVTQPSPDTDHPYLLVVTSHSHTTQNLNVLQGDPSAKVSSTLLLCIHTYKVTQKSENMSMIWDFTYLCCWSVVSSSGTCDSSSWRTCQTSCLQLSKTFQRQFRGRWHNQYVVYNKQNAVFSLLWATPYTRAFYTFFKIYSSCRQFHSSLQRKLWSLQHH